MPTPGQAAQLEFSAESGLRVSVLHADFSMLFHRLYEFVSSNHFLGQFGAAIRLYVTPKIFIRPEAHLYEVHNNIEFSGSRATALVFRSAIPLRIRNNRLQLIA